MPGEKPLTRPDLSDELIDIIEQLHVVIAALDSRSRDLDRALAGGLISLVSVQIRRLETIKGRVSTAPDEEKISTGGDA